MWASVAEIPWLGLENLGLKEIMNANSTFESAHIINDQEMIDPRGLHEMGHFAR
jgi:hypothetical protein